MRCERAETLISQFIDNALSARDTWELEKHLAECNACTRQMNETRRTVALLAGAQRFEVSDDFVANLQARLATVEREPARASWVESLRAMITPRALPVWGAALGACALIGIVISQALPPASVEQPTTPSSPEARLVQTARTQGVALAASDPFGDPAAASMAASISSSQTSSAGQPNSTDSAGETVF